MCYTNKKPCYPFCVYQTDAAAKQITEQLMKKYENIIFSWSVFQTFFNFLFVSSYSRFLTCFVPINPKLQVSGNTDKQSWLRGQWGSKYNSQRTLSVAFLSVSDLEWEYISRFLLCWRLWLCSSHCLYLLSMSVGFCVRIYFSLSTSVFVNICVSSSVCVSVYVPGIPGCLCTFRERLRVLRLRLYQQFASLQLWHFSSSRILVWYSIKLNYKPQLWN